MGILTWASVIAIAGATVVPAATSQAEQLCKHSKSKNEWRYVPATYGTCPGTAPSLQIKEVPDVPDNFNTRPLAFRYAYFYPATTIAYYTSCSGTGEATIRYEGPVERCNLATK
jgi:hypothetical protein